MNTSRIVAQNIKGRAAERRLNEQPQKVKTALVIQGGGVRGITSCTAAAALEHLGLRNAFDAIYGVSAGAVNAVYFLSGQAALGVSVYLEDVTSRRFISPYRWPRVMNLDFLFEEIVKRKKKHDLAALRRHPTPLHFVATDSVTGNPAWFCSKDEGIDLHLALKASCAVPIASRPVKIEHRRLMDGNLVEPIPLVTALEEDYSDVLVLHTRDLGYRSPERSRGIVNRAVDLMARWDLSPRAYELFRHEPALFNRLAERLEKGIYRNQSGREVRIACAFPKGVTAMSRFERNRDRLLHAALSSWRAVMEMFGRADVGDESLSSDIEQAKALAASP